ncbi:LysR family transcriptional regulator [Alteromonas sp. 5E99-2]|uniref:LysR family transcriptional regulator n=1 Tax=Alteromonas sp. 5E99-2 TaxID=2817683 RepID=UPI001A982ADE|nr:LysR family transcriptional regulator [Alteromonas sp. 5E99-2]MBO1256588.1 LysR family transcriptional regulator [Alteromonas sp. 5E99-2]
MKIFVEVAKHQSFVLASKNLSLSAPAVTRAIAFLEDRLRIKLFHRTTRHVRLTQPGTQFLIDTKRILEDIDSAEANAAGVYGQPIGTLNLTAPVLFGQLFVVPIIAKYLDTYPQVNVTAHYLDKVSSLLDEELEVAIRIGHLKDSGLFAKQVGTVKLQVVASPDYLSNHGTPRVLEDLKQHKIIAASASYKVNTWDFFDKGQPRRIHISPRLICNQNTAALESAILGQGLCRLMSYQVGDAIAKGQLVSVLGDFEEDPIPVTIVHLEGRKANAKVRAFIDMAAEILEQNPYIHSFS